jgi:diguanylate cyclase (GGDEF)-like protein
MGELDYQQHSIGRSDESVSSALSELEEVVKGCDGETRARAALDVLRRAFTSVRTSATTDPLTGLANRPAFYQLLEERLLSAATNGSAAVLFLDLDGFKCVNDERGHAAGDALLADVAGRISRSVREHDLVARHGGDEFVVLLEHIENRSIAHAVAARIIEAVSAPFVHGDDMVMLGVSIGVAFAPEHGMSSAELLQRADQAMYRAKALGGRTYSVYGERDGLTEPRDSRRSWAWELSPVQTGRGGTLANDNVQGLEIRHQKR